MASRDRTGLDALVVQASVLDPATYVTQWITTERPNDRTTERPAARPARSAAWLDWFKANNVEAIGGGVVMLRAGEHDELGILLPVRDEHR